MVCGAQLVMRQPLGEIKGISQVEETKHGNFGWQGSERIIFEIPGDRKKKKETKKVVRNECLGRGEGFTDSWNKLSVNNSVGRDSSLLFSRELHQNDKKKGVRLGLNYSEGKGLQGGTLC